MDEILLVSTTILFDHSARENHSDTSDKHSCYLIPGKELFKAINSDQFAMITWWVFDLVQLLLLSLFYVKIPQKWWNVLWYKQIPFVIVGSQGNLFLICLGIALQYWIVVDRSLFLIQGGAPLAWILSVSISLTFISFNYILNFST